MLIPRGSPRFGSEAAWMIALKVECREFLVLVSSRSCFNEIGL
jgi:hypothetical protein